MFAVPKGTLRKGSTLIPVITHSSTKWGRLLTSLQSVPVSTPSTLKSSSASLHLTEILTSYEDACKSLAMTRKIRDESEKKD
ncbi:hypothetical protein V1507DRAFT_448179 [Lipomyces tetrasporus]